MAVWSFVEQNALLLGTVVCLVIIIAMWLPPPAIVERRESASRKAKKARIRTRVQRQRVIAYCHKRALVICKEGGSVGKIERNNTCTAITLVLPEGTTLTCRMYLRLFTIVKGRAQEEVAAINRRDYADLAEFRNACTNAFEEVISLPVLV